MKLGNLCCYGDAPMKPKDRFVRSVTRATVAGCAVLLALANPLAAQGPSPQVVRIGILARKPPPPPTFTFNAVPEDEGLAGARAALRENQTTGAFTGQRYVLDEAVVDEGDSPVAAARKLIESGTGLIAVNLPGDE